MFKKYHWFSQELRKQARICNFVSLGFVVVALLVYFISPSSISNTNIILVLITVAGLQYYCNRVQNKDKRLRRQELIQRKERYPGL